MPCRRLRAVLLVSVCTACAAAPGAVAAGPIHIPSNPTPIGPNPPASVIPKPKPPPPPPPPAAKPPAPALPDTGGAPGLAALAGLGMVLAGVGLRLRES